VSIGVRGEFVGMPTISSSRTEGRRWTLLRDAFRPFYVAAALFSAIALPVWLGTWYHGYFPPRLVPLLWHTHEMVYGFVAAVMTGFLFTAGRRWTGLPIHSSATLAGLAALWLAARAGMFFFYGRACAVIDTLFLPTVAFMLLRAFARARSFRNVPIAGILLALGITNALFHLGALGALDLPPLVCVEAGLMLVVMVELIVAGRVIPAFTSAGVPGARMFRFSLLDAFTLSLAAATFAGDGFGVDPMLTGVTALFASLLAAARGAGWNPVAARRSPMLLVLHAGHAWIPLGLLLLFLAAVEIVPRSAAIHAFAAGSTGGLIIGMITRTALGHSDRPIRAGRGEIAMFILVHASALLRVAAAVIPSIYFGGMLAAGIAWFLAFVLYLICYARLLLRPG